MPFREIERRDIRPIVRLAGHGPNFGFAAEIWILGSSGPSCTFKLGTVQAVRSTPNSRACDGQTEGEGIDSSMMKPS
jgi:hypothetical protein